MPLSRKLIVWLLILCLGSSGTIPSGVSYADDADGDGFDDETWLPVEMDPGTGGGGSPDPMPDPGPAFPPGQDSDGDGLTDNEETEGIVLTIDRFIPGPSGSEQWAGLTGSRVTETVTVFPDRLDADSDDDGLPDAFEVWWGFHPTDPIDGTADEDFDGLTNGEEYGIGTDWYDGDSDNDLLPDGYEVEEGLNPLWPGDGLADPDGDLLANGEEYWLGTDWNVADTDGDLWWDSQEVTLGTNPLNPADPGAPPPGNDPPPGGGDAPLGENPPPAGGDAPPGDDPPGENPPPPGGDDEPLPGDDPPPGDGGLPSDLDTDGDGLMDVAEIAGFTIPGYTFMYETGVPLSWNGHHGVWLEWGPPMTVWPDRFIADTDGDLLPDGIELEWHFNPADPVEGNSDADGDGLSNGREYQLGTDWYAADTDGDLVDDWFEVWFGYDPRNPADGGSDEDGDGLTLAAERQLGTNWRQADSDGDGWWDPDEGLAGTDPLNPGDFPAPPPPPGDEGGAGGGGPVDDDTDDDGLTDVEELGGMWITIQVFTPDQAGTAEWFGQMGYWSTQSTVVGTDPADADSDDDRLPDGFEVDWGYDPTDPRDGIADADGDGLSKGREYELGTNWFLSDSDGDLFPDYWEATLGYNPLDPADGNADADGDGLSLGLEFRYQTNPAMADTDGDGWSDGAEIQHRTHPLNRLSFPTPPPPPPPAPPAPAPNPAPGSTGSTGTGSDGSTTPAVPSLNPVPRPTGDADGDGLSDAWERRAGLDPNAAADATADPDGDGLTTLAEFRKGTHWLRADSDGDGLLDGTEVYGTTRTHPVLPPHAQPWFETVSVYDPETGEFLGTETVTHEPTVQPETYITHPLVRDSDHDGYGDGWELANGLDPLDPSDVAGVSITQLPERFQSWHAAHGLDLYYGGDEDGDGLDNASEFYHRADPFSADTDLDGIADGEEISGFYVLFSAAHEETLTHYDFDLEGNEFIESTETIWVEESGAWFYTDPANPDTDGDGFSDGWERDHGTSPSDPIEGWTDSDGDGVRDGQEHALGTNPDAADSDGDGLGDAWELANGTDLLSNADGAALADWDEDGFTNASEARMGTDSLLRNVAPEGYRPPILPDAAAAGFAAADDGAVSSAGLPDGVFLTARGGVGYWGAEQFGSDYYLGADGIYQPFGGGWTSKLGPVSFGSAGHAEQTLSQSVGRDDAGDFYRYGGVTSAQSVAFSLQGGLGSNGYPLPGGIGFDRDAKEFRLEVVGPTAGGTVLMQIRQNRYIVGAPTEEPLVGTSIAAFHFEPATEEDSFQVATVALSEGANYVRTDGKGLILEPADRANEVNVLLMDLLPMELVEVTPEGLVPVEAPTVSSSAPAFSNVSIQIGEVAEDTEGGFNVQLNLSGEVRSALLDTIPGSDGVITTIDAEFNGGGESGQSFQIPVTGDKEFRPVSILKRHEFNGSFSRSEITVKGVEGVNHIRLTAIDPLYGDDAVIEYSFTIAVEETVPEPSPEPDPGDCQGTGYDGPPPVRTVTWEQPQQIGRPLAPQAFGHAVSPSGQAHVYMLRIPRNVTRADLGLIIRRAETSDQNLIFKELSVPYWQETKPIDRNFLYLSTPNGEPWILHLVFQPNLEGLPSANQISQRVQHADNNLEAFFMGLSDGGIFCFNQYKGDTSALIHVAKAMAGAAKSFAEDPIAKIKLGASSTIEFAGKSYDFAVDSSLFFYDLSQFMLTATEEQWDDVVLKLLTGEIPGWDSLTSTQQALLLNGAELFDAVWQEFSTEYTNLDAKDKSYIVAAIVGYLAGEALAGKGAGTATKFLKLSKVAFLENLRTLPFFRTGIPRRALDRLDIFKGAMKSSQMCFIPGTLVMTAQGSLPIEQIRPGMEVWSRDEFTKAEGWKPVLQTFTTHPEELFTLAFDTDGDGAADEELTGTGEHPFWVEDFRMFLPLSKLRLGMRLSVARKSGEVVVVGNVSKRGPPRESFTTYNLEVDDYHTYFVGRLGVWVHNRGDDCERLFSLFQRFLKKTGNDPWQAHGLAMQRFDGLVGADPRLARNGIARVQLFTEARRRHFNDLGGHTPLWRQGEQNLLLTRPPAENKQMADELRRNMRNIFKCDPEGLNFAVHHIVPHSMPGPDWDRARQILNSANVHFNEAANGVFVPQILATAEAYPSLGKLHNYAFHDDAMAKKVADRLEVAAQGGKTAVQDELQRIANDIANSLLP